MPDQTYQLPRDSTMQGIVTQLQNIASRMNNSGSGSGGSGGGSTVVANPSGTASDDLTSIEIDGTVYDIPSGSGSSYDDTALVALINSKSTVVANPQGTPDGELTAIEIDGDIYEIVSSGGSGSSSGRGSFDTTLLWDYETDNNNAVLYGLSTATLHDDVENYDALIIEVVSTSSDESDPTWQGTCQFYIDVNALENAFNQNYVLCESVANRSCKYYISGTTLQKTAQATADTNGLVKVYGIKYGSDSGSTGSGYSITSLYNNDSGLTTVGEITLSGSILDYDDLEFIVGINTNVDHSHQSYRISTKYFYDYFKYGTQHSDDHFMVSPWYDMVCGFTLGQNNDPTKINFYDMYTGNSSVNTALYSINGIKYGSGGGGGGSQVRELLYEAESSTPSNTITFTNNLTDYDSILFEVIEPGNTTWVYSNFFSKEMIENAIVTGNVLTINYTTPNMYIMYVVTDAKTLTLNTYRTGYISKIWGVKGGSGSGGGGSSYAESDKYSTTEKVIGKWIDGKPIYQKTFTINVHTDGMAWVDTGCVIPNIEHIIDWSIVCNDTYVSGAPANIKTCSFRYYNNNIQIYGNTEWYLDLQAIIVKYTKSTD